MSITRKFLISFLFGQIYSYHHPTLFQTLFIHFCNVISVISNLPLSNPTNLYATFIQPTLSPSKLPLCQLVSIKFTTSRLTSIKFRFINLFLSKSRLTRLTILPLSKLNLFLSNSALSISFHHTYLCQTYCFQVFSIQLECHVFLVIYRCLVFCDLRQPMPSLFLFELQEGLTCEVIQSSNTYVIRSCLGLLREFSILRTSGLDSFAAYQAGTLCGRTSKQLRNYNRPAPADCRS